MESSFNKIILIKTYKKSNAKCRIFFIFLIVQKIFILISCAEYMYDSLVLLSGGLDSTTLLYDLKKREKKTRSIYFDLNTYPTPREIYSIKRVTFNLDIPLDIVDLSGIIPMTRGYSSQYFDRVDELDVGGFRRISGFHILLSIALYYSNITNIKNIELGVIKEQFNEFKNLQKFLDEFPFIVNLINKDASDVKIHYPFIESYKKDIIKLGKDLGLQFEDTWSCLFGREEHCGECNGCISRKNAFKTSKIPDPTKYLK